MRLQIWLSLLFLGFANPSFAKTEILFLGDSITAGYGVLPEESYPSVLASEWRKKGKDLTVINAAESGSLASGISKVLAFHLKRGKPKVIVIVSGGNDARQLTPVTRIESALRDVIQASKKSGATVVLGEMRIFPNYGKEYVDSFAAIYPRLAKIEKVELMPFLLEGVAGDPKLNLPDGFHPNRDGHAKIATKIGPYLEKFL